MAYLDRLEASSRQGFPSAQQDSAQVQPMPPPPARSAQLKPPAGRKSLQQQAVLAAAAQTGLTPGPLGTIPDDAPFDSVCQTSASAASASSQSSTQQYHLTNWDQYFDDAKDLQLHNRQGTFRVYLAGKTGPVVFCLHGGGYSGLTWALLAKQLQGRARLVAMDQRGHGCTHTDQDEDLSADTLVQDAIGVWAELYGEEQPPVVLVGHSMGGAVAVRCAATKAVANLQGLVVIDVVEGTALPALPHMATILRQRPQSFPSPEAAVHWARRSGMSRCTEAACISMPSCLVPEPHTAEQKNALSGSNWVWRTNLLLSQPFWEGWYKGLSDLYMTVTVPKVLVLAGTDRLDGPLTVGQMQGKFQLVLLPQAGHAVHEDQSERTADVIATFIQRFRVGQPKMAIPKANNAGLPVLPVPAGPVMNPNDRGP